MSFTVYVPRDSSAVSLGADKVARAVAAEGAKRGTSVKLVRNGSRGMFWLEPMVEVQTREGRIAYGPVDAKDVASLYENNFLYGGEHHLRLGPTEEIPYFKQQERLTFARVGIVDPVSIDDYIAHGGYRGLKSAQAMEPDRKSVV